MIVLRRNKRMWCKSWSWQQLLRRKPSQESSGKKWKHHNFKFPDIINSIYIRHGQIWLHQGSAGTSATGNLSLLMFKCKVTWPHRLANSRGEFLGFIRRHPNSCHAPNVIAGRLRDFAALPLSEAETRPPAHAKQWKKSTEATSQTMERFWKQMSIEMDRVLTHQNFDQKRAKWWRVSDVKCLLWERILPDHSLSILSLCTMSWQNLS